MPDGDYAGFVERSSAPADRSGPILDRAGRELGRHGGVHRFTVGQRRGLGLASPRPRYVLAVRPDTRTVVVGDEDELLSDHLVARDVTWLSVPEPVGEIRSRARIRYRHAEAPASIRPLGGGRAEVRFDAAAAGGDAGPGRGSSTTARSASGAGWDRVRDSSGGDAPVRPELRSPTGRPRAAAPGALPAPLPAGPPSSSMPSPDVTLPSSSRHSTRKRRRWLGPSSPTTA